MTTYVIGDIQGCFTTFQHLLDEVQFYAGRDNLILLGDLVNRGKDSLATLRFIKRYANSIQVVLGNHDIYALALHHQAIAKENHTLHELLNAPDANEIFSWLKQQPFLLTDRSHAFVHAGVLPILNLDEAQSLANTISKRMQQDPRRFLGEFLSGSFLDWSDALSFDDKQKVALSGFLFMRMCEGAKKINRTYTDNLNDVPAYLTPWFRLRQHDDKSIYFGHWASIGPYQEGGYYCLDSGCVWGNKLSALNLSTGELISVKSEEH